MKQLKLSTLASLPSQIKTPKYDLQNTQCGIVHIGPGAFHRAHQAYYTELALEKGGDWRIHGVSMRSNTLKQELSDQDNLYTLAALDNESSMQVIGAIKDLSTLSNDRKDIEEALAAPETKIVTLTVTEKGYCLNAAGELDRENADIKHDLANQQAPISAVGLLVQMLNTRMVKGLKEVTIISCDNVTDNGKKLKKAVVQLAHEYSPELATWIEQTIAFPCTMVDSITPATDENFKTLVYQTLGVFDNWPIQREAFTQWIIEDEFSGPRPHWDQVGVIFTKDVSFFERAKLRVLNGTHSSLAYIGTLCGKTTVYEAISEPSIKAFIQRLLAQEIIPTLGETHDMDVEAYAQAIIQRYENRHIRHMLSQIAWDGSQKLPFRILGTVRDHIKQGTSYSLLCAPIAAWCLFLALRETDDEKLVDPLADKLLSLAKQHKGDISALVDAVLDQKQVFAELSDNRDFRQIVQQKVQLLSTLTPDNIDEVMEQLK
ncbi:mannitol dehydrogenase family protein [Glaciecola sp. 1036]|uniref:mannitol dehydrogenase family protein n=1 Tax=Alteromonadaceae TaxID=72275 RepID=UPI003CFF55F5